MLDNTEKPRNYKTDKNGYMFPGEEQDILQEIECEIPVVGGSQYIKDNNIPNTMPELVLDHPQTIAEKKVRGKYMKKRIWPWVILSILLIILLIAGGILFWIDNQQVKLVTLNGEEQIMTNVSPDKFAHMYDNIMVSFTEGGQKETYTYKDLGIQIQWTEAQKALFDEFEVNLDDMYFYFNFSQELKNIIWSLNDNRQDWVSATFIETDEAFVVTPEIRGNKVDIEAVEQYVIEHFGLTDLIVNLDEFKLPEPEGFITDVEYNNELFQWSQFYVLYTNGFTITADDIKPFFTLNEEHKIVFNPETRDALSEQVWEWVNEDLDSYNTMGGTHRFITHDGPTVELKGVNYGDKVNKQKEHDFLVEVIENLWTCPERIPEMSIDYPDDIQSNVIEISIEAQHLWYWQDGQILMETDIVTGWKNKWDTPTGVYRILNQIDGVYLIGADYKTWVDKWMRFWEGYGLHDATWRNKFGGEIYTRDGSHGCINLPHAFAVKLYDLVEPGDCVVIY